MSKVVATIWQSGPRFCSRSLCTVPGVEAVPSGEYCLFGTLRHMGMHQPVGNRLRRTNRAGLAVLTISFAAALSTVGCGVQYRPVVSAIGPVGPAGQPTKYAVAVSSPSTTSPGLVTVVDFSGDTVLSTPQIQTNPSYFQLGTNGTQGFTVNTNGSLDTIPLANPLTLLTSKQYPPATRNCRRTRRTRRFWLKWRSPTPISESLRKRIPSSRALARRTRRTSTSPTLKSR